MLLSLDLFFVPGVFWFVLFFVWDVHAWERSAPSLLILLTGLGLSL